MDKEKIIEVLKKDLKESLVAFLNHKYIIEKIKDQENNPEFIMELYDIVNDINSLIKKTIKNKQAPEEPIFTEDEAFLMVIEYNKQAKEIKKIDKKESKKFYNKKAILLKKYGTPLCIHSLKGGYKVVLVKLKNGTFHCPIDEYSLDEIENLKVEDYEGGIE